MPDASGRPDVSVIIGSYNSRHTIADCLNSLRNQNTRHRFEVLVVDSSSDGTAACVRTQFPEVKLLAFSERKYVGDARNVGIAAARAPLIAFLDADCSAAADWIEQIVKAHESADLGIGGAIANHEPSNYVAWSAYFCEFSRWMPGSRPRRMTDIAAASMSYKREVFEQYGSFLCGTYCSDTEFHWRLGRAGHGLRFAPDILVFHHTLRGLRAYLAHELEHGRFFARVRVKSHGFSRMRNAVYAAGSPLIPLIVFARIGWAHVTNRVYLARFLASIPLVLAGLGSWALGECLGYLRGAVREA